MGSSRARIGLAVASVLVIAFLWIPLLLIMAYAFNGSTLQTWPISHPTFHWFHEAWRDPDARSSLWLSVKVGLVATAIALVLGTAAAAAIYRFRFFGREAVSFLLLLPIALPGIITGMALNSAFNFAGVTFSMETIVVGHATFCVVLVYNNVLARLRRSSPSLIEASMDLGADGWQTFRWVIWPVLSTALVAGGLLAFALSFDEVIVTFFTAGAQKTLPLYILDHIERGQDLPVINAIVFVVILATVVPVTVAQRLTGDAGVVRGRAGASKAAAAATGGGAV
jgi:putative spermidine/putrescine transport system permease protein